MQAELAQQLTEEVKGKLPLFDLTAEDVVLITITTLYTMAGFSARDAAHNRARFLRSAGDMVESILTAD